MSGAHPLRPSGARVGHQGTRAPGSGLASCVNPRNTHSKQSNAASHAFANPPKPVCTGCDSTLYPEHVQAPDLRPHRDRGGDKATPNRSAPQCAPPHGRPRPGRSAAPCAAKVGACRFPAGRRCFGWCPSVPRLGPSVSSAAGALAATLRLRAVLAALALVAQRRGRCASLPGAAVAAVTPAQSLRAGASAADVTPSEATGAAVEPDRSLQRTQLPGIRHGG